MRAIANVPHPEALNSLKVMLGSIGIDVFRGDGREYNNVIRSFRYVPNHVDRADEGEIHVEVKPELLAGKKNPILFFLNGGLPEAESDYPTITANFNMKNAFTCYWPYVNRLGLKPRKRLKTYDKPIDLCHGGFGWGFARYYKPLMGEVDFWGFNAPLGALPQAAVGVKLSSALCLLHLKSNDAPGFALYEAFASATPVIVSQYFVETTKYHDLFIDGETCLIFGKDCVGWHTKHASEEPREVYDEIITEIRGMMERLKNPEENYRIGMNGLFEWFKLTRWTKEKRDALRKYLEGRGVL